ncbi:Pentatricopeptide repeat [Dillenia turbinata]|uniref:Pentatricopeptide repeat n=1 Tax=Dillenia turbinata TaxID=194707 RepID=A0AAN8ZK01_9MAGN
MGCFLRQFRFSDTWSCTWREDSFKGISLIKSQLGVYSLHAVKLACFVLASPFIVTFTGAASEIMRFGDVQPDAITFVGLLNACTYARLIDQGCHYFEAMTVNYGIEPQIEHYGCLINLLVRAGRFKDVMDVINGMRIEPDEAASGSLLNGCEIHNQTELAEFAVRKLVEMDPNNGGYGTMLTNINVVLGKWDEVRTVRKELKERNAHKMPGCSWIEVDGLVHQFYSADKTHPKSDEIYKALEGFA